MRRINIIKEKVDNKHLGFIFHVGIKGFELLTEAFKLFKDKKDGRNNR
jgi:hypothetical protein